MATDILVVEIQYFQFVKGSRKTTWSKGHVTLSMGVPHGKVPSCHFNGLRHCGRGDMFLVDEEQDSRCCPLNLSLLFISKAHSLKPHGISY